MAFRNREAPETPKTPKFWSAHAAGDGLIRSNQTPESAMKLVKTAGICGIGICYELALKPPIPSSRLDHERRCKE